MPSARRKFTLCGVGLSHKGVECQDRVINLIILWAQRLYQETKDDA